MVNDLPSSAVGFLPQMCGRNFSPYFIKGGTLLIFAYA